MKRAYTVAVDGVVVGKRTSERIYTHAVVVRDTQESRAKRAAGYRTLATKYRADGNEEIALRMEQYAREAEVGSGYGPWVVDSWAGRLDLAEKVASRYMKKNPNQDVRVKPVSFIVKPSRRIPLDRMQVESHEDSPSLEDEGKNLGSYES